MKSGSTLIEVIVSIVILAIIAIAGAAYLVQSDTTITIQRNRMSALATANRYLEEWRGTPWVTITNRLPSPPSYATTYVTRTNLCGWSARSASVVVGYVTNNDVRMTVTNALNYVDADGILPNSYDCVRVTVSVVDPRRAETAVVLQTILGTY